MKKVIKACFMVFAFLAAIVVFAPKTFARPVPVIVDSDNYVAVTDITINGASRVNVGDSIYLTAVVSPSNATIKKVKWSSSNSEIATVDSNGKVTGQSNGYANIKATINDYEGVRTETKRVQVTNGMVTSVKINGDFETINGEHYFEMRSGQKEHFVATVLPVYAKNQAVKWSSSDTKVATVTANGYVNALSSGVTTITVTTVDGKKKDSVKVYIDAKIPEWTLMIYMCPNDRESKETGYTDEDNQYCSAGTKDITEILSVPNKPDDINVVIQTDGYTEWRPTYNIPTGKSMRYSVKNSSILNTRLLNEEEDLGNIDMSSASSFKDFLIWGMKEKPAKHYGVIMYGHGKGMMGVCQVGGNSDNVLFNSEMNYALENAFAEVGRSSSTEKMDFIAYNSCGMAVQDIAEVNSHYFKYMVASQDTVYDSGFEYNKLIMDLYQKKDTVTILKNIVDNYVGDAQNWDIDTEIRDFRPEGCKKRETLSVLDLSKMANYKKAWEEFAVALKNKLGSSQDKNIKEKFAGFVSKVSKNKVNLNRALLWGYNTGLYDVKEFLNRLKNSVYNPNTKDKDYITPVINCLNQMVIKSETGYNSAVCYGLSMYYSTGAGCWKNEYYTKSQTSFYNWLELVEKYGL